MGRGKSARHLLRGERASGGNGIVLTNVVRARGSVFLTGATASADDIHSGGGGPGRWSIERLRDVNSEWTLAAAMYTRFDTAERG